MIYQVTESISGDWRIVSALTPKHAVILYLESDAPVNPDNESWEWKFQVTPVTNILYTEPQ